MKKTRSSKKIGVIPVIIPIAAAVIISGVVLFFTTDIYINRAFHAKRDFSKAFSARITGNCETFYEYIIKDIEAWRLKCTREKMLSTDPFYGFTVLNVTTRGKQAFIQAELIRGPQKTTYPVTYEMKLTNNRWMINQNANN
jgi:hypothetical protein